MSQCQIAKDLHKQLREAFLSWYEIKDVPGKKNLARQAERKIGHIRRSLSDHLRKHNCSVDAVETTGN